MPSSFDSRADPRASTESPGAGARPIETSARALGALSICSGLGMLWSPTRMAELYALPHRRGLVRALGARDVLIGGLLMREESEALGLRLRQAADSLDAALIAGRMAARHAGDRKAALRLLGSLALVLTSSRLGRELVESGLP